MHSMKSQAKSSAASKKAAIMGQSPIAKAATKYATNTSGQTGEKQKYPTRAMGGMVTEGSSVPGRAGGGRLDRPPRVGVSIGNPMAGGIAPGVGGAPLAINGPVASGMPLVGGPMTGGAEPNPMAMPPGAISGGPAAMPGVSGLPAQALRDVAMRRDGGFQGGGMRERMEAATGGAINGYKRGGKVKMPFEGSPKDMAMDKAGAKKAGMSMKKFERSPMDAKMDKAGAAGAFKMGGAIKGKMPAAEKVMGPMETKPLRAAGGKVKAYAAGGTVNKAGSGSGLGRLENAAAQKRHGG